MAKTDSEYSNLSVAKGMPAVSVENFADNGVAFAPGIVNGKEYWRSRTEFPGTLIWQPIFAFAAAGGDLGFTTGRWELKKGTDEPALGYGNYVTIWARQRDRKWKIAADVGTKTRNRANRHQISKFCRPILQRAREHRKRRVAN